MRPSRGERAAELLLALLKSGCYLVLFLGMQVLVMMPVIMAAAIQAVMEGGMVDEELLVSQVLDNAMLYSLISQLLTLAVIIVFYLVRRKRLGEALWLRRVEAPTLWEGAALAPGLYLVVTLVLTALPEEWLKSYNQASAGLSTGGLIGLIAIVFGAPVVEEIIFRGLIMTRLSRAVPGWLAVLLSAAIFGLCHGNPVWFSYAFVLGTIFGFMDLRAGSIWPSILSHMVFNSIDQILELLPESGRGVFWIILIVVAIVAPILDRKAIAAIFRPRPAAIPAQELPMASEPYDFDPWEE